MQRGRNATERLLVIHQSVTELPGGGSHMRMHLSGLDEVERRHPTAQGLRFEFFHLIRHNCRNDDRESIAALSDAVTRFFASAAFRH